MLCFFFQAEDGIRDLVRSRGLGDVYKRQLEYIEKGKTVVVFCHIPPNNFSSERNDSSDKASVTVVNRELLYSILKGYKSYIITGHMHESEFISEQGVQIHVCGAVCGAWWSDNICYDGTPNGYMPVSYTHLRAHETVLDLVCRLLLEKKTN